MVGLKTELESKELSENCKIVTYITYDEKTYVLEINLNDGRFVAEKQFSNDFNGIAHMEEIKSQYRSEDDVKRHFGII